MPTIVGLRTVDTILGDQIKVAMDEAMQLILPEAAPMITALMKTSKRSVPNTTFKHMEEEPFPRSITFTAAVAVAGVSATVSTTHGSYFAIAATDTNIAIPVLVTRTHEVIIVTGETTGTLTIVKGRGGTTDQAILSGDEGLILATAGREDSSAPEPLSIKKVLKTFYCQMFRDAFEISKTAVGTEMYHGNDRTYQQRMKLIKQKMDMEYALLLNGSGENYDIDADGVGKMRFATGALGVITGTNVVDCGNNMTRPMLWDALARAGEYHFGDWWCAGSPLFHRIVNGWAHDAIRPANPVLTKKYGVNLQALETPEGTLNLAKEKILKGNILKKYAFIFPMPVEDFIRWRPFVGGGEDGNTKLYPDIKKDNNPQIYKDEYMTHGGFQFYQVSKMLILKNIG